jgi:Family of unknown function (DUF5519)
VKSTKVIAKKEGWDMLTISDAIKQEVLTWAEVTVMPHRFGGIEFRVKDREFGHLHGDYQGDIPFTSRLRKELVAAGKAELHHLYPNSGWISYYIKGQEDVPLLLELLRMNYDRLAKARVENKGEKIAA